MADPDDALRATIVARFPPGALLAVHLRRPATDHEWLTAAKLTVPRARSSCASSPAGGHRSGQERVETARPGPHNRDGHHSLSR